MTTLKKQRLLVIAPHPDDEVVGCGGLIKKIKDAGGKVYVLFLTVGDTRDFSTRGISTGSERQREIEKVAKFLKFDGYHLAFGGNEYHLKLDLLGQKALMDLIERDSPLSLQKTKPTIIAFPSPSSYNQDHRLAATAAHAALRPSSGKFKHNVATVLSYESPAELWRLSEQEINYYVPLTEGDLAHKLKALKLYSSQARQKPNPRSFEVLRALATLRGSQCGSEWAEGYTLYRGIL